MTAWCIAVSARSVIKIGHIGRVCHRIVLHNHCILSVVQIKRREVFSKCRKLRIIDHPRQCPSADQSVTGILQLASDTSRTARLQCLQQCIVTAHVVERQIYLGYLAALSHDVFQQTHTVNVRTADQLKSRHAAQAIEGHASVWIGQLGKVHDLDGCHARRHL